MVIFQKALKSILTIFKELSLKLHDAYDIQIETQYQTKFLAIILWKCFGTISLYFLSIELENVELYFWERSVTTDLPWNCLNSSLLLLELLTVSKINWKRKNCIKKNEYKTKVVFCFSFIFTFIMPFFKEEGYIV